VYIGSTRLYTKVCRDFEYNGDGRTAIVQGGARNKLVRKIEHKSICFARHGRFEHRCGQTLIFFQVDAVEPRKLGPKQIKKLSGYSIRWLASASTCYSRICLQRMQLAITELDFIMYIITSLWPTTLCRRSDMSAPITLPVCSNK
jgi:hypothetical protein